ncbi:hypothetical protein EK904_004639 [Melospiza melodia maxima]|nr:hypothetical protein EK904_004639 [Melospiza melodia maxima]
MSSHYFASVELLTPVPSGYNTLSSQKLQPDILLNFMLEVTWCAKASGFCIWRSGFKSTRLICPLDVVICTSPNHRNKNKQREGFLGLMREQLHLQFSLLAEYLEVEMPWKSIMDWFMHRRTTQMSSSLNNMLAINTSLLSCEAHTVTGRDNVVRLNRSFRQSSSAFSLRTSIERHDVSRSWASSLRLISFILILCPCQTTALDKERQVFRRRRNQDVRGRFKAQQAPPELNSESEDYSPSSSETVRSPNSPF